MRFGERRRNPDGLSKILREANKNLPEGEPKPVSTRSKKDPRSIRKTLSGHGVTVTDAQLEELEKNSDTFFRKAWELLERKSSAYRRRRLSKGEKLVDPLDTGFFNNPRNHKDYQDVYSEVVRELTKK